MRLVDWRCAGPSHCDFADHVYRGGVDFSVERTSLHAPLLVRNSVFMVAGETN